MAKTEGTIAQAEQQFINSTKESVLRPFYSFVDNDAKTIFKVRIERRQTHERVTF